MLLLPIFLFWVVLLSRIPVSFSRHFNAYSPGLFLVILVLYYMFFRLPDKYGVLACLGFTMILFALSLSYKWASGFSDSFIVGGLIPYKDAKNYYYGANLLLNGIPMVDIGQATERPLFPGFLSSMLMLTGQNLRIALAIITQLAGIGLYLSARRIHNSMGTLSASLYSVLIYFFIQSYIGYTLSESLGFMLGCFAFSIIWHVSNDLKWFDLVLGLIGLLAAVSARAGAFIIFPMLVLWTGWIFRGEKRYSARTAIIVFVVIVAGYLTVNTLYARFLRIPPGFTFGNFSYALYGQVKGGIGWHSAVEELGTREPIVVYRAALDFFLEHPTDLLVGFAKSYRDFFLPGNHSIFAFAFDGWKDWPNFVLWMGVMILLLRGFVRCLKDFRLNLPSLLFLGFAGVFLSIPFLPPIDGGARFHASTIPFFFVLPAFALSSLQKDAGQNASLGKLSQGEFYLLRYGMVLLLFFTGVMPVLIYRLKTQPMVDAPICRSNQRAFVIKTSPGSYVDLIPDGMNNCGWMSSVCISDFDRNGVQKETDDFVQKLLFLAQSSESGIRIMSAMNLRDQQFRYFVNLPHNGLVIPENQLVSGCAIPIQMRIQIIYQIESITPYEK